MSFRQSMKHFLPLAIPFASTAIISMLGMMSSIMLISKLGKDHLAASALMLSCHAIVLTIFNSILFSIGVFSSAAIGTKNYSEIGSIFKNAQIVCIFLSLIAILVLKAAPLILLLMGQDPQLVELAQSYFQGLAYGVPAVLIGTCCTQILLTMHKAALILLLVLLDSIMFVLLSAVFVFGLLGAPKLGSYGVGLAFSISQWVSAFIYFSYFLYHKEMKKYQFFQKGGISCNGIIKQIKLGLPISVELGLEQILLVSLTIIIGWGGKNILAVHQIVNQYIFIATAVVYCAAHVNAVIVSQYHGSGNNLEALRSGNHNIIAAFLFAVIIALMYTIFCRLFAAPFLKPDDLVSIETNHFLFMLFLLQSISLAIDTLRHAIAGSLRGLQNTQTAMWVSILPLVLVILTGLLLSKGVLDSVYSVFYVRILSLVVAVLLLLRIWLQKHQILQLEVQFQ